MMEKIKPAEGLAAPSGSRKWHYFRNGRSLCARWIYRGDLEIGADSSPENCTACRAKMAAAIAAMREPTPAVLQAATGIFPERAVRMVWERQIDAALLEPLSENHPLTAPKFAAPR
jgi:hypothetical protein